MAVLSKPTVYLFKRSSWCACVRISIIELGVENAVTIHQASFTRAENLLPEFVTMSPAGTLPALSAPEGVCGDTASTIAYLAALSAARTGRRIARRTGLCEELHLETRDSKFMTFSACDDAELAAKAAGPLLRGLISRQAWTRTYAASPSGARHGARYAAKIAHVDRIIALYTGNAPPAGRAAFFAASAANRVAARALVFGRLDAALRAAPRGGPFVGGAAPGEDDLHVIGWFAHVAWCAGARRPEDALGAMAKMFGAELPSAVKRMWEAWTRRASFRAVYEGGIY